MKFQWNNLKNRTTALILTVCILLCAAGGMVYAKYIKDIDNSENVNIIAEGKLNITVTSEGTTYTITNTNTDESNMPAYVRFTVVVNKIKDGHIWAIDPGSYTITATGCTKIGDCYYYNGTLAKGGSFNVTVSSSETDLQVQVLAEGIQCVPASVAQTAWGHTYDSETNKWN